MAGFDVQLPDLAPSAVTFLPEVREADELWPPLGTPEPNLHARGMTEARCVIQYFHGRTTGERLDALKHLANICVIRLAAVTGPALIVVGGDGRVAATSGAERS